MRVGRVSCMVHGEAKLAREKGWGGGKLTFLVAHEGHFGARQEGRVFCLRLRLPASQTGGKVRQAG